MIVGTIRTETRRTSTKFRIVTTRQVRAHFAPLGLTTKHGIATSIAKQFEELSWKLPQRRKPYQSEAPVMAVFDAVANGIAFFWTQTPSSPDIQPAF